MREIIRINQDWHCLCKSPFLWYEGGMKMLWLLDNEEKRKRPIASRVPTNGTIVRSQEIKLKITQSSEQGRKHTAIDPHSKFQVGRGVPARTPMLKSARV